MTGAVRIIVRLTPKGGRDAIEGWSLDANGARVLKARVAAAPESGKANRALVSLLAASLGLAKSRIRIVRGESARTKTLEILDGEKIAAKLEALGAVR